jgi:hypothetical protein
MPTNCTEPIMGSQYLHKSLSSEDSFRVIQLLPSRDPESIVKCELLELSVSKPGSYEALSYIWAASPARSTYIAMARVSTSRRTAMLHFDGLNAPIPETDYLCRRDLHRSDEYCREGRSKQKMVITDFRRELRSVQSRRC